MKFALVSDHAGGVEVPEHEKEAHLIAFGKWLQMIKPSMALPVHGGVSVTSNAVENYKGAVAGVLVFEAESLEEAIEKTQKSPGLKYGWTHDVLKEMLL
ncbi:MAG: YciI family protein [Candidatus Pacebacteria bacterium]|nr:YciI family protein [Candidatus Paceibacterota bacterium]